MSAFQRLPGLRSNAGRAPYGGGNKRKAMESDKVKLNIGAGGTYLPGFTPIDRKSGKEAACLDYSDGTVDEVYASHVLEHFGFGELVDVLGEWVRVLKPGGRIRLAVPDFDFIAKRWVETANNGRDDHEPQGFSESQMLRRYVLGGQTDENDFHKSAFDEHGLRELMRHVGIENVKPWKSEIQDCASMDVSLNLEGTKSETACPDGKTLVRKRISAVMSCPKLGFTENMWCAAQVLATRGVSMTKNTGAFWGQCMERCMMVAIESGAEWILTLDYDTCFTAAQFEQLCRDLAEHPEADAVAPWQVKRETDDPLVWFLDEAGEHRSEIPLSEFEADVTKAANAHFGLTLFRVEALKKMTHPWFLAKPAPDGTWGEGRQDDDIYFWNHWAEVGNTLYLSNRTSIGHLQQVITWVDKETRRPIHQYITDFQKNGPPKGVRQ